MLINCTNPADPDDNFVINPPSVLPKGTKISYHDRSYVIEDILYDDDSGVIDYVVSLDPHKCSKGMEAQVLEYCRNNMKLQAVKYVKETMNVGLKDAKDYVDELWEKYKI